MPHDVVAEGTDVPHGVVTERANVPQVDVTERRAGDRGDSSKHRGIFHTLDQRYRVATKLGKGRILDEVVAHTGYHRKHAIRLLRCGVAPPRSRCCDDRLRDALIAAWELTGRAGSRRLKQLLPDLVMSMATEGRLPRDPFFRGKLLSLSAATIDRVLAPVRAKTRIMLLEEKLETVSKRLTELRDFTIPPDLTPEDHHHLEACLAVVRQTLRQNLRDRPPAA